MAKYLTITPPVDRPQKIRRRGRKEYVALTWRERLALAGVAAAVLIAAVAAVWSSQRTLSLAYEIDDEVSRKKELELDRNLLNDEINRLNDRARLEREAARLGFVKIEPAQKIVVDPGDAS